MVFISIWSQYAELVIWGTQISLTYPPIGAFLVLIVLVVFVQWPLTFLSRKLALNKRELVMVWSMLSLAIGVASIDFAQKVPPMIAGTIYYATPENRYDERFLPHIQSWLTPQDPQIVKGLFEGSPFGVPWGPWIGPLAMWSLFFVLAYFVMLCGAALFQRQWIEREKLLFPLVVVPLEVIDQPVAGRVLNTFFRNPLMWIGLFFGAAPHIYSGLNAYFPNVPRIEVIDWGRRLSQRGLSRPWTPLNGIVMAILPLIIGLSFLMTREISLSLWVFYWIGKLEEIFGVALGLEGWRSHSGGEGFPFQGLQTAGAYIGLAAASIYSARYVLRNVFSGEERAELHAGISARVVVIGGLIAFALMVAWCMMAGMSALSAIIVLGISMVYLLAMTRLVSEAGMPWCHEPMFRGHNALTALFPGRTFPVQQWVATGMLLTFSHDLRVAPMPRVMQSYKMTAETGSKNSDLLWSLGIALAISIPVSLWALMKDAHLHGGVAMNTYRFVTLARQPGMFMDQVTTTGMRAGVDMVAIAATGFGLGKLLLLNMMRTRFMWWPLHPVGYAMSFIVYLRKEWFSVFIGWVLQSVVIRYGGQKGYLMARPLFLGLILGAMAAGGFWLVFDGFTGLRGHKILY